MANYHFCDKPTGKWTHRPTHLQIHKDNIYSYQKCGALWALLLASVRGCGTPFALLGDFGPLFSSRGYQTKYNQFSIKIDSNTIFGGNQLKFQIFGLQLFKQLKYSIVENPNIGDTISKWVLLIDFGGNQQRIQILALKLFKSLRFRN